MGPAPSSHVDGSTASVSEPHTDYRSTLRYNYTSLLPSVLSTLSLLCHLLSTTTRTSFYNDKTLYLFRLLLYSTLLYSITCTLSPSPCSPPFLPPSSTNLINPLSSLPQLYCPITHLPTCLTSFSPEQKGDGLQTLQTRRARWPRGRKRRMGRRRRR